MKSTGIVRKVDELGRIVIPREMRRNMNIQEKDPLEIFLDGNKVVLQKHHENMASYLSGEVSEENISLANGKLVLSAEEAEELANEILNWAQKN